MTEINTTGIIDADSNRKANVDPLTSDPTKNGLHVIVDSAIPGSTVYSNVLDEYANNDTDKVSSVLEYYGFTKADGGWFIMEVVPNVSVRYAAGASAYTTAWTGRAGQTYDYFDVTF